MTKHTKYKCKQPCEKYYCYFCQGGLFMCTVCHGAEGTLTTDCPEYYICEEIQELCYAGKLDYIDGMWRNLDKDNEDNLNFIRSRLLYHFTNNYRD